MKNLKLIGFLMILASSLMFIQCTTDTLQGVDGKDGAQGIAGIDGIDGVDGLDGMDGLDGESIAECIACHSNEHRDAINDAYDMSKHATGGSWGRGTSGSCAQCHNNEGFIDFVETGATQSSYAVSNPISCTGCHKAHRSFDFDNDGNDMALRTLEPVTLIVDENYIIDATNESDMLGKSNTCVVCHQPRTSGPESDATYAGKYFQTSTHWGPHHGPQSTLLEGIEGMEFASTDIAAPGTAAHRTKASCVSCHMTTVDEGHTWDPADNASSTCVKCHDAKPEVAGYATGMATLAEKLATVVGQEISNKDATGATVPYYPVFEADGVTPVLVTGIVIDGHPHTGLFDIKDAQAAWNYLFLLEDKSNGVHNPVYAKKLIELANQQF